MQLAGPGVYEPPADRAVARAVLHRAVEPGVDHIDTAQFCGPDGADELIRDALHPYRGCAWCRRSAPLATAGACTAPRRYAPQRAQSPPTRRKGRAIGLGNATVDEIPGALEMVDLGEVQNAYN